MIYEFIIERFSLDPADYDNRTTLTKICFLRLPQSDLLNMDLDESNPNITFKQSLLRVQSRSLKGFYHYILK